MMVKVRDGEEYTYEEVKFDKEQQDSFDKIFEDITKLLSYKNQELPLRILNEFNEKVKTNLLIASKYGGKYAILDVLAPVVGTLSQSKISKISLQLTERDDRLEAVKKYKNNILTFLYFLDFDQDAVEDYAKKTAQYKTYIDEAYNLSIELNGKRETETVKNKISEEEKIKREKEIYDCYGSSEYKNKSGRKYVGKNF